MNRFGEIGKKTAAGKSCYHGEATGKLKFSCMNGHPENEHSKKAYTDPYNEKSASYNNTLGIHCFVNVKRLTIIRLHLAIYLLPFRGESD